MAPARRVLGAALAAALVCGCAPEQLARGVYEGAKARNDSLKGTPREQPGSELPGYEEYDRERKAPR